MGTRLKEPQDQHRNQCCPNLDLDSIGTGAKEGLDLKILLQGFKEDLNMPTLFVDGSNGCSPQFQVIGQDHCFKDCLTAYGGYGYSHVISNLVPLIRLKGITEKQINKLLLDNPKHMFQITKNTDSKIIKSLKKMNNLLLFLNS